MKPKFSFGAFAILLVAGPAFSGFAQASDGPYKLLKTSQVGGAGGFDYVFADSASRKLYIPRGNRVVVYDLPSLTQAGEISPTSNVHGVAVDTGSHHGFSSSNPVVMWDTRTLAVIKTIPVEGSPDGIFFDPFTSRILVLSHRSPHVTAIEGDSGAIAGTIDLRGAPEQGATDGKGLLYIDVEDKDTVAVVDARSLKVVGSFVLGTAKTPAGLALDIKNNILFVCCRNPAVCVILDATHGTILSTLPIGAGTDGAAFNPRTQEAFSSQRDGTVTVIKENGPKDFSVVQNVGTKVGARTCSLDHETGQLYLVTADYAPAPTAAPEQANGQPGRRARGEMIPDTFSILVVGK